MLLTNLACLGKGSGCLCVSTAAVLPWLEGLYAENDLGAVYDPSFAGSVLSDDLGTVASDGDRVYLQLDVKDGLQMSDNIAGVSTITGEVTQEPIKTYPSGAILEPTKVYRITFDVVNYSGVNAVGIDENEDVLRSAIVVSGNGSYSFTVRINSNRSGEIEFFTSSTNVCDFENISVREIPGHHRLMSNVAYQPMYETDGTLHWLYYDGSRYMASGDDMDATSINNITLLTAAEADTSGTTIRTIANKNGSGFQSFLLRSADGVANQLEVVMAGTNSTRRVEIGGQPSTLKAVLTAKSYLDYPLVSLKVNDNTAITDTGSITPDGYGNSLWYWGGQDGNTSRAFIGKEYASVLIMASRTDQELVPVQDMLADRAGI